MLVADHWQYYSIVGVTALAAAGNWRLALASVADSRLLAWSPGWW